MSEVPALLEIVKSLGAGAVPFLVLLWWLERKERIECQKDNKEQQAQILEGLNRAANAMASSSAAVTELRGSFATFTTSMTSLIKSLKRM